MVISDMLDFRPAVLLSPLSPQTCADRLNEAAGNIGDWADPKLTGWANARRLRLRKPGRGGGFETILRASIEPSGSGTVIRCRFGLPFSGLAFATVWFGFLGIVGIAATGPHSGDSPWPGLLGFGGAMVAMIVISRWMAKDERAYILGWVVRRTEADLAEGKN